MWRALTVALLTGGLLVPTPAVTADDGVVLTFHDRRITESSGLVDLRSVMVTANDSGGRGRVFVVSAHTGRTVGITAYGADPVDVEALAPAGGDVVWVGDIGDNRNRRKHVTVYRVDVATGGRRVHAPAYRLVYPRGSHDAESMFTDRRGRLYVITKAFTGGVVYRAPLHLRRHRDNRLEPVGRVLEYATDAARMPDGRHVLVRGLGLVGVYTFPGLQRIGSFRLPRQRQGEGISVGPGNRVRLSSEGVHSPVREVSIPPVIVRRMSPRPLPSATPSATPSSGSSSSPSTGPANLSASPGASPTTKDGGTIQSIAAHWAAKPWLMISIPGVIALGALGIGLGLRRRSE